MKIKWYNTIDSTFSAMENGKESLTHKEVWAARFQRAGKGQKGNVWSSREGENLMFSIFLVHKEILARHQFGISQAISLGVCDYLRQKGVTASIKWPNDIYVGESKICGILIQNTVKGAALQDSIVGIGLNINQTDFPEWIPNPTSLKTVTGGEYIPEDELVPLLERIFEEYDNLSDDTARRYMDLLYLKGIRHQYTDTSTGRQFWGTITSVVKDGRLEIKTADGYYRYFAFKEVAY